MMAHAPVVPAVPGSLLVSTRLAVAVWRNGDTPPVSARTEILRVLVCRLFGGDSMYEVLVEVARLRRRHFHAFEIAQRIDRHASQVQRDLARLTAIGVLEEIEARGAAQPMRRRSTRLARSVVSLPRLIEVRDRRLQARRCGRRERRDLVGVLAISGRRGR
jgi:hypothetical protein